MKIIAALCAFFIWAQTGTGYAQMFPDRAIRFIVPNPAGGSNDAAARILANALSELWPYGVVIENRGGGGGNVGAQAAATAPADGYVLLLTSPGPLTINPSLYKRLPFDPEKDFAPVALVATVPIVLMVNPKVPANTVQNSLRLPSVSKGSSTTPHPASARRIIWPPRFSRQWQTLSCSTFLIGAEAGLPDFEASSWFGLVAPSETSPAILTKITADVKKVVALPEVQRRFEESGAQAGAIFARDFGRFLRKKRDKWAEVIKASGAQAE
jgi:tripartite-type tricarboxylate transporter receptor subunit TctC